MKKRNALHLVAVLICGRLFAQSTAGALEGCVLEGGTIPIPNVNVAVTGESLQGMRGALTDPSGRFRIVALPAGDYTVKITHIAYKSSVLEHINIKLGKTTSLGTLFLFHKAVAMPDVTTVSTPVLIDPSESENSANLAGKTIEQLPIERNYRNAVVLLPQMNTSYLGDEINMAGATGLENKYIIDGMDVTDPFRNITGTNLPYNFVQDIEVKTGSYAAEYRSSLGGIINVITYSGGNQLHGQLFGFFSDHRFAAEPRQGLALPAAGEFSQYDVGFRIGGPIVRDKLWFSLAYNPITENEQVQLPGLGYYLDHSVTHSFAAKVTLQAGRKNNLVLTVFGDPQNRQGVGDTFGSFGTPAGFANPDPWLLEIKRGGINSSCLGRHIISDRWVLESSASLLTRQEKNGPSTPRGRAETLFIDAANIWSGGGPTATANTSTVVSLGVKASYMTKTHSFKIGAEYRDNRLDANGLGSMVVQTGETNYFQWNNFVKGIVHTRMPAAFVQDSWQATDRLNVLVGFRWDGQFFYANNGIMAQSITSQYQPRLGLAYQPDKEKRQKIYLSLGRFYQDLCSWFSSGFFTEGDIMSFKYYNADPRNSAIKPVHGFDVIGELRPALTDLEGQYDDAYTMGYELQLSQKIKCGFHATFHSLGQGIEDGMDPISGDSWYDNPGKGVLKLYPKMKREYTSIELKAERPFDGRNGFTAAYVWSRTYGNYMGLFNSDYNYPFPNCNGSYDVLEVMENATGLLPNDRTHVFKFFGSCAIIKSLMGGAYVAWQSGTPLSELGGSVMGPPYNRFIGARGSKGRMPALWDINVRLAYSLKTLAGVDMEPRIILDLFHIASRRTPVNYEQIHYYNLDENGNNINTNPLYGLATRFQPPMSLRLGLELNF